MVGAALLSLVLTQAPEGLLGDLRWSDEKPLPYPLPQLEIAGYELALNLFDRYVLHGDYAEVTPTQIAMNFARGPKYDNDDILLNFVGHPYQGAIGFNLPRSLGIGFWTSAAYGLAADVAWELLGEVMKPSLNDFIESGVAGPLWGEALHRIARLLVSSDGSVAGVRAVGAFLLDPGGIINAAALGVPTSEAALPAKPFRARVYGGAQGWTPAVTGPQALLGGDIVYGERRHGTKGCIAPFDEFEGGADLAIGGHLGLDAHALGVVAGCGFGAQGLPGVWGLLGLTDFGTGAGFRWGATSLGPGTILEWQGPGLRARASVAAAVTVVAASGSIVQTDGDPPVSDTSPSRYTMGPGGTAQARGELALFDTVTVRASIATWGIAAAVPRPGLERVDELGLGVELALPARQFLGAEGFATRRLPARPDDPPQQGWALRAFWGFRLQQSD